MTNNKHKAVMVIAYAIALSMLHGCSIEEPPKVHEVKIDVNDENCKIEKIKLIPDQEAREEFAGRCFRRGEFVQSVKKSW